MNRLIKIFAISVLFLGGCDLLAPSGFEPEVVISAFLVAGEPFPDIRVSESIPVEQQYDADSAAVRDARVRLQLLNEDGIVEDEFEYQYLSQSPGIYIYDVEDSGAQISGPGVHSAIRADSIVLPLRSYGLVVDVPGYDQIRSTTVVPDTFSLHRVSQDTVTFQADEPFAFEVTPPHYPGRQSVFVFNTIALDGFEHQLTPFARSLLEDGDDVTIVDLRERVSPILNEENFDFQPGGTLRIQFPWLAIYFYGRNRINIQALDDNLYDFMRSRSVQQGGSTRPPGEIPNIIDHIDGGRGIFGSYAQATVDFYVRPQED